MWDLFAQVSGWKNDQVPWRHEVATRSRWCQTSLWGRLTTNETHLSG